MRLSTLAIAFLAAACGTALTLGAAQALEVSTTCMTPQALSQALKDEGQTLIIVGNQAVRKEGSPEVGDYAMRAVYLNPETGRGYVAAANVPFDPTGATSRPATCATVELKLDNARIYNQSSMDVSASALVPGDRLAALALCAHQPVVEQQRRCEFHNDAATSFVHGQTGMMFQGTVTSATSDAPVGSIATLFGHRVNGYGGFTYTSQSGILNYGHSFNVVRYTEKGIALAQRADQWDKTIIEFGGRHITQAEAQEVRKYTVNHRAETVDWGLKNGQFKTEAEGNQFVDREARLYELNVKDRAGTLH